jgi:hypothetical protein
MPLLSEYIFGFNSVHLELDVYLVTYLGSGVLAKKSDMSCIRYSLSPSDENSKLAWNKDSIL